MQASEGELNLKWGLDNLLQGVNALRGSHGARAKSEIFAMKIFIVLLNFSKL